VKLEKKIVKGNNPHQSSGAWGEETTKEGEEGHKNAKVQE